MRSASWLIPVSSTELPLTSPSRHSTATSMWPRMPSTRTCAIGSMVFPCRTDPKRRLDVCTNPLTGLDALFAQLADCRGCLLDPVQAHRAQCRSGLRELDLAVVDDLDEVAPRIAEVQAAAEPLHAGLDQPLAGG